MSDIILFVSKHSEFCIEPYKLAILAGIKVIGMDSKDMRRYFSKVTSVPSLRCSNQIGETTVHYYIYGRPQVMAWLQQLLSPSTFEEEVEQTKIDLKDIPPEKGTELVDGGAPEIKASSSR